MSVSEVRTENTAPMPDIDMLRQANHRIADHLALLAGTVQSQVSAVGSGPLSRSRDRARAMLQETAGKLIHRPPIWARRAPPFPDRRRLNLRRLLHWFRQFDSWLVAPALLVVIYGELGHAQVISTLETDVWDKSLHFTAYFGLAMMTTIAVRADRRALWWALGLVLLGGALEIVQGFTGRDADIFDELANTLGVVCGLAIAWGAIALLKARKLIENGPAQDV